MAGRNVTPVVKFEVGIYKDLKKRSKGDTYDVHHMLQKAVGHKLIEGYDENNAVCIVVPKNYHRQIETLTQAEAFRLYDGRHPRSILAADVHRNRRILPQMPEEDQIAFRRAMMKAIKLHCELYPETYSIPLQDSNFAPSSTTDSDHRPRTFKITPSDLAEPHIITLDGNVGNDAESYFDQLGAHGHGGSIDHCKSIRTLLLQPFSIAFTLTFPRKFKRYHSRTPFAKKTC